MPLLLCLCNLTVGTMDLLAQAVFIFDCRYRGFIGTSHFYVLLPVPRIYWHKPFFYLTADTEDSLA